MKLPTWGLRTRVTAAVVLVTTTATAVMAVAAASLQRDNVIDGFTFAAESSFGAMFGQVWPSLQKTIANGHTDTPSLISAVSDPTANISQEWMLYAKSPDGSIKMVTYASTTALRTPQPAPVRVNDRPAVMATVADKVLVRTASPADLQTATTVDPESGQKLLVVSGNYADYWMVELFDMTPLELSLAEQPQKLVYFALAVATLGIVAAVFAAWHIQRPVRRVASAARELGDGTYDVRVPVKGRDELADLAASFNTMAQRISESIEELRAKDRQQQRFVADVAHDLRTPLASMVATVDALETTGPENRATQLLGTQTRRLARLVEDLMEISRFDAGSADFRPEPVDLPALVEDAIEVNVPGTEVRVQTSGDLEVVADPRRVHTVVGNLLVNAVRHGRAPVVVSIEGGEDVTIRVSDSGAGIPEELLPILFDRFVRGDQARQATEGSGLGLSIARENALVHGGTLTAHNDDGAVFTLTLPRRAVSPPA
ncbi:sensor histidine kinase [Amycolatopsis jejuensis]|uniref:sensor histidine kinase n=1 Tax=Amycolatopsis jejuensis TaxID=330084 RepID=UPI0005258113|nr:HAMP domain-containing sensor histidine kinase [Amycolatopsis jejuensis]